MQAQYPAPPPAPQHTAQTRKSQEVMPPPPRWETLPAENRRHLSQVLARVLIRHSLLTSKEAPDD